MASSKERALETILADALEQFIIPAARVDFIRDQLDICASRRTWGADPACRGLFFAAHYAMRGVAGADTRVVVLGAGFGGLTFCEAFEHPQASVTVVDRTNHHLFQPLLYQVATAGLSAPDIAQPVRSILSHKPRLEVLMDQVQVKSSPRLQLQILIEPSH